MAVRDVTEEMIQSVRDRRTFLTGLGLATAGVAAAGLAGCSGSGMSMTSTASAQATSTNDSATQIFTAALIAEDLAITTYYNILVGGAIQDSNLAGSGGTATNVSASGSQVNVAYLQAALAEEVQHAILLRGLLGIKTDGSADASLSVPAMFYYPTGTFDTLTAALPVLVALETAFIGAYMLAVEEFASMAAGYNNFSATQANPAASGTNYTQAQLINFAKVSAAILGVESEHRALVRGIPSVTVANPVYAGITVLPANNLNYETQAGLTGELVSISGSSSTTAAAALAPFLATSASNSAGFSLATALSGAAAVSLTTTGSIPTAE